MNTVSKFLYVVLVNFALMATFLPMVGIVVTTSPNFNLYSSVVFPAASNPVNQRKSMTSCKNNAHNFEIAQFVKFNFPFFTIHSSQKLDSK